MSNKYIEKSFIYLLFFSLLIHVGVLVFLYYLPEGKQAPPKEPVFIDLQQVPEPKLQKQQQQQEVSRLSDQRIRVERERVPQGTDIRDRKPPEPPRPPAKPQPPVLPREAAPEVPRESLSTGKPSRLLPAEHREAQVAPGSSVASLLKPRQQAQRQQPQPQLFPGAGKMAKLEESYRRKFETEIAEGETSFLNTDDIQFGSFLRRFENSVYGVWRYPAEAARNGIEGITPVRITFSRNGEIIKVKLLESSGSRILDDEVVRTLKAIGPIGAFPKGYDKDEFNLIAFFQYGGTGRALR